MLRELVVAPVLEQARGLRAHLPLARRELAPGVHVLAHLVDDPGLVVLLLLGREPLAFVEDHLGLLRAALALLRPGNRSDERHAPALVEDAVGRLPVRVQLPVDGRVLVRRVQDGPFEERRHQRLAPDCKRQPPASLAVRRVDELRGEIGHRLDGNRDVLRTEFGHGPLAAFNRWVMARLHGG
jgi:hypothetical protein